MLEQLKQRNAKIIQRMKDIEMKIDNEKDTMSMEELESITVEAKNLGEELKQVETEMRNAAQAMFKEGERVNMNEKDNKVIELRTKRGEDLKQKRAVEFGSLDVVKPTHEASDIIPTFKQTSDVVDLVRVLVLNGGESFKQPYLISNPEGGYTAEGNDYADAEPSFGQALINKSKITAYAEHTEELEKLAHADYDLEIQRGLTVSLRKKLTREILFGAGGADKLTGIFTAGATAIQAATDKQIAAITENTLDEILLAYGSTEEYTPAVLILSKATLREFAKVRGTADKKKVYNIDYVAQTIDGIPYVITSVLPGVAEATTGQYYLGYGSLHNYLLAVFSPTTAQKSSDYKFKQGIVAVKASSFMGGNVVAHNGFLRVKKPTT